MDSLRLQFSQEFEFLREEYKGNIAYLFVYNSLIFRIPLWLKPMYSSILMAMETLIEKVIRGRLLSCFVACQWRKR